MSKRVYWGGQLALTLIFGLWLAAASRVRAKELAAQADVRAFDAAYATGKATVGDCERWAKPRGLVCSGTQAPAFLIDKADRYLRIESALHHQMKETAALLIGKAEATGFDPRIAAYHAVLDSLRARDGGASTTRLAAIRDANRHIAEAIKAAPEDPFVRRERLRLNTRLPSLLADSRALREDLKFFESWRGDSPGWESIREAAGKYADRLPGARP